MRLYSSQSLLLLIKCTPTWKHRPRSVPEPHRSDPVDVDDIEVWFSDSVVVTDVDGVNRRAAVQIAS